MAAQTFTALAGDKLDLLLWREAGLGPEHIGPVLAANPGLADLGAILPLGTTVIVPGRAANTEEPRTLQLIQLWSL